MITSADASQSDPRRVFFAFSRELSIASANFLFASLSSNCSCTRSFFSCFSCFCQSHEYLCAFSSAKVPLKSQSASEQLKSKESAIPPKLNQGAKLTSNEYRDTCELPSSLF